MKVATYKPRLHFPAQRGGPVLPTPARPSETPRVLPINMKESASMSISDCPACGLDPSCSSAIALCEDELPRNRLLTRRHTDGFPRCYQPSRAVLMCCETIRAGTPFKVVRIDCFAEIEAYAAPSTGGFGADLHGARDSAAGPIKGYSMSAPHAGSALRLRRAIVEGSSLPCQDIDQRLRGCGTKR